MRSLAAVRSDGYAGGSRLGSDEEGGHVERRGGAASDGQREPVEGREVRGQRSGLGRQPGGRDGHGAIDVVDPTDVLPDLDAHGSGVGRRRDHVDGERTERADSLGGQAADGQDAYRSEDTEHITVGGAQTGVGDRKQGSAERARERSGDELRPTVRGRRDHDGPGRGVAGQYCCVVVAAGGVPRDRGQLDPEHAWVLATALDDAADVRAARAVPVDVGIVDGAAVADLLEAIVRTASVAGVPAPAPDVVGAVAVEGGALRRDSGLAAHSGVGLAGEDRGNGGAGGDHHRHLAGAVKEGATGQTGGRPSGQPLDSRVEPTLGAGGRFSHLGSPVRWGREAPRAFLRLDRVCWRRRGS